jgi:hypothetical protein
MKRYIFLLLCLSCLHVQAQDAYVVHYKDGSTLRVPHGIHTGSISLWNLDTGGQTGRDFKTYSSAEMSAKMGYAFHGNATLQEDDEVTAVWKDQEGKGIYTVLLILPVSTPTSLPYHLCIGTAPGQDIEHTDTLLTLEKPTRRRSDTQYCISVGLGERTVSDYSNSSGSFGGMSFEIGNFSNNNFRLPLLHGQTYYYRLVASIPAMRPDGQCDTVTVYGPELSFRIPDLAGESGEMPSELVRAELSLPSKEAWHQFLEDHFGGSERASHRGLSELWLEWLQTDDGRAAASALPATVHDYDDARVTFYETVPADFASWIRRHEMAWSRPEDFRVPTVAVAAAAGIVNSPITTVEQVDDSNSTWRNPVGSYLRFSPTTPEGYSQQVIAAGTFVPVEQVVPGVSYRLAITFAPETDTEHYPDLPTPICIEHWSQDHGYVPTLSAADKTQLYASSKDEGLIPATEPTTLTFDLAPDALLGRILYVRSNVTRSGIRHGDHSGIFRLAEMRLTPLDKE